MWAFFCACMPAVGLGCFYICSALVACGIGFLPFCAFLLATFSSLFVAHRMMEFESVTAAEGLLQANGCQGDHMHESAVCLIYNH